MGVDSGRRPTLFFTDCMLRRRLVQVLFDVVVLLVRRLSQSLGRRPRPTKRNSRCILPRGTGCDCPALARSAHWQAWEVDVSN